jgi:hypothetical protein
MAQDQGGGGESWWWLPLIGGPSPGDPLGTPGVKYIQSAGRPPMGQGPFATKADAEANYKEQQHGVHNPSAGGALGDAGSAVSSALGITELGHEVGTLVSDVTDPHLYISLGWLLLGFLLFVIGLMYLLRIPEKAAGAAEKVGTVAALAA